jgi:hypothetical protein
LRSELNHAFDYAEPQSSSQATGDKFESCSDTLRAVALEAYRARYMDEMASLSQR